MPAVPVISISIFMDPGCSLVTSVFLSWLTFHNVSFRSTTFKSTMLMQTVCVYYNSKYIVKYCWAGKYGDLYRNIVLPFLTVSRSTRIFFLHNLFSLISFFQVRYNLAEFLEKNRDTLAQSLIVTMRSEFPWRSMFWSEGSATERCHLCHPPSDLFPPRSFSFYIHLITSYTLCPTADHCTPLDGQTASSVKCFKLIFWALLLLGSFSMNSRTLFLSTFLSHPDTLKLHLIQRVAHSFSVRCSKPRSRPRVPSHPATDSAARAGLRLTSTVCHRLGWHARVLEWWRKNPVSD